MKKTCNYCGTVISKSDQKCPTCGAILAEKTPKANKTPRTIKELKQWYIDKNLPGENITRFFIGQDYKNPRAFGIYKDEETGNFIVYKNKADGSRAIRYQGTDEAYAVRELYLKLKQEIQNQKSHNQSSYSKRKYRSGISVVFLISIIFFIIVFAAIISIIFNFGPQRGYYLYNDDYYYYQSGSWYEYDDYMGWYYVDVHDDLRNNYKDYYQSSNFSSYYDIDNFENSDYYVEPSYYDDDDDYDYDWDSGSSWDSSISDWDSDW